MFDRAGRQSRGSYRYSGGSAPTRLWLPVQNGSVLVDLWLLRPAGISALRNGRVSYPRPCKRYPSLLRRVSRRCGNARWFRRSLKKCPPQVASSYGCHLWPSTNEASQLCGARPHSLSESLSPLRLRLIFSFLLEACLPYVAVPRSPADRQTQIRPGPQCRPQSPSLRCRTWVPHLRRCGTPRSRRRDPQMEEDPPANHGQIVVQQKHDPAAADRHTSNTPTSRPQSCLRRAAASVCPTVETPASSRTAPAASPDKPEYPAKTDRQKQRAVLPPLWPVPLPQPSPVHGFRSNRATGSPPSQVASQPPLPASPADSPSRRAWPPVHACDSR